MSIVDLMPALRERNGVVPNKSGERLTADLASVRDQTNKLVAIVASEFLDRDAVSVVGIQNTLHTFLNEIDGIDTQNPPPPEALELLSSRLKLTASAITLLLQKKVIARLQDDLCSELKTHQSLPGLSSGSH